MGALGSGPSGYILVGGEIYITYNDYLVNSISLSPTLYFHIVNHLLVIHYTVTTC